MGRRISRGQIAEVLIVLLLLVMCGYYFSKQPRQTGFEDLAVLAVRPGMSREAVCKLKGKSTETFKCDDSEDGNRDGVIFGAGQSGIICIFEKDIVRVVIGTELSQASRQLVQSGDPIAKVRANLDPIMGNPVAEGYGEVVYEQPNGRLKLTFSEKSMIKVELLK